MSAIMGMMASVPGAAAANAVLGPPNIDNLSLVTSKDLLAPANIWGMTFKPDGTVLYAVDTGSQIMSWPLTVAWDISTVETGNRTTVDENTLNWNTNSEFDPKSISFKDDGTKLAVGGNASQSYPRPFRLYSLSSAWDITSMSLAHTEVVTDYNVECNEMHLRKISDTDYIAYTISKNTDSNPEHSIKEFDINSGWTNVTEGTAQEGDNPAWTYLKGMGMTADGLRMFVTEIPPAQSTTYMRQYDIFPAWDMSTVTYDRRVSMGILEGCSSNTPGAGYFREDANKWYQLGSEELHEFDM